MGPRQVHSTKISHLHSVKAFGRRRPFPDASKYIHSLYSIHFYLVPLLTSFCRNMHLHVNFFIQYQWIAKQSLTLNFNSTHFDLPTSFNQVLIVILNKSPAFEDLFHYKFVCRVNGRCNRCKNIGYSC